jgi:hypothetical protein
MDGSADSTRTGTPSNASAADHGTACSCTNATKSYSTIGPVAVVPRGPDAAQPASAKPATSAATIDADRAGTACTAGRAGRRAGPMGGGSGRAACRRSRSLADQ